MLGNFVRGAKYERQMDDSFRRSAAVAGGEVNWRFRPVADGRASTKQTVSCGDGRETGEQTGTVPLLNHLIGTQQQRLRDV